MDSPKSIGSDGHRTSDTSGTGEDERAAVQGFADKFLSLWRQRANERDAKELSLSTFPFTPAERRSLRDASRQGLWEGTLAGLATFAVLRGGPWILTRIFHPSKGKTSNFFQSPFTKKSAVPISAAYSHMVTPSSSRRRWMEAGFLLIDVSLCFGVAMAVSTHFSPNGDPVLESIVGMPGLAEAPANGQPAKQSVIIHQVCPLALDLFKTLQQQEEGKILSQKPQTYYLDALQRFVRNCERRRRVEQTTAWQELHNEEMA